MSNEWDSFFNSKQRATEDFMSDRCARCPACGGELRRETRAVTYKYCGSTVTVSQPEWYCKACDEALLDPDDLAAKRASLEALLSGGCGPGGRR